MERPASETESDEADFNHGYASSLEERTLKSSELSNFWRRDFFEARSCLPRQCPSEWQIAMNEPGPASSSKQNHTNLFMLLCFGFVLSGIATVILGPLLPVFIQRWSLDDGQAGLFSTVQFSVALAGTLASSAIASRWGFRPPLVVGYALMAGGVACLNARSHTGTLAATATFGFGYGLVTAITNLLVAEMGGTKSASLLNLLNSSWGVGAMACSPLIAWALKNGGLRGVLIGYAIFGSMLVLGLLFVSVGAEKHGHPSDPAGATPVPSRLLILLPLATLFFIYVAMENGIGFWIAEYSRRITRAMTELTTLTQMFFYAGLTAGRATAPLVLRKLSENKVVIGSLVLAATGNALLIFASSLKIALIAIFLCGLGCASVYPIYIAWLSRWYGVRARKIGGILFAVASLGGSCGAWMIGSVSKLSGSLRIGFAVPLSNALVMIFLVLLLRRRTTA
jgi:fucose permease